MKTKFSQLLSACAIGIAIAVTANPAVGQIGFNEPIPTDAITLTNKVGMLAVVNDKPITDVDLAYRINLDLQTANLPNTNENRASIALQSFDNLIFDQIKISEAAEQGIQITDTDVARGLADIAQRNGQTPTAFMENLANTGVPATTFTSMLQAQFAWRSLTGRAIARQSDISDAEINAEIARINSLRGRRERLMSEIFLPYVAYGSAEQAITTANTIVAQLRGGGVFGDLARQYSRSPTAGLGGQMGWVAEGTLAPEIEQALAGMFTGQITERPIQTREGVYVFGIQNSRPIGSSNSRTLVRLFQLFRTIPTNQQSYEAQQDFVILNSATLEARNCAQFQTYINTYGDVGSGDMGTVDLASLPPSISQILAVLPQGEASAVLPVPNGGSVFMVCGKSEEVDPITREEIENRLLGERREALTLRFERDLRRQAIIDYRF